MNWKILNIEPTSDKDRIRQAYAKEVKCWHPEEHPKEFRMLQEAYREALRLADQADPRDEIRFVSEDISQSGVREPQFRQALQANQRNRSGNSRFLKKSQTVRNRNGR